jgi:TRAP-type mannitol/chloroaromatic compound transport system permease small subunit
MRQHRTLLDLIDTISEWTGKAVSFLIIGMIVVTILVVLLRYIFNLAPFWNPITSYTNLLSVYVILGAAYALRAGAHVNVDILYSRLPPRMKAVTDMVTSVVFFLFFLILLRYLIEKALGTELSPSINLFTPPFWPVVLLWPVGITLMLLQGLAGFARNLVFAVTGEEAQ